MPKKKTKKSKFWKKNWKSIISMSIISIILILFFIGLTQGWFAESFDVLSDLTDDEEENGNGGGGGGGGNGDDDGTTATCSQIKNPAIPSVCEQASGCSAGTECTFHTGGIFQSRWCSCDTIETAEGDSEDEQFCLDNDYTQQQFDASLLTRSTCEDLTQTGYIDKCDGDFLIEYSCPLSGDDIKCNPTTINCAGYITDGVCKDGLCVAGECEINLDCWYGLGEGWVCREGQCVAVTSENCNQIVQDEGFTAGIWDPMTTESRSCYMACVEECPNGCSGRSEGGTWGLCCGYECA